MVNSFQEVRVGTSLFADYILDDTLDNVTSNGNNGINDNDDDEIYINHNYGNNDFIDHNDHNDDNDNNYGNNNGGQTTMILQAMYLGEPFVCEKVGFCESAQILMSLHSVIPCLIYTEELRFSKKYRNGTSRSLCKVDMLGR